MRLNRFKLGTRLFGILAVILVFTLAMLGFFFLQMASLRSTATAQTGEAVMTGIREKVQVATHSMALSLASVLEDVTDQEEKEQILRDAVDDIRFEEDDSGYYFVYRDTTVITVPTNESLQGQDLAETADQNGVFYVAELAQAAAAGGGFVDYVFEKPGAGLQPKVSYAQMIPGTDYWIGTGVYADNVMQRQAQVAELINEQTRQSLLLSSIAIAGFFLLLMLPLIVSIARSILRPVAVLRDASRRIAEGDLQVDVAVTGRDEIAGLLRTTLNMRDRLTEVVADMKGVGDSVSDGSRETAEIAQHMAEGASRQASTTEELASSMEEMNSNIQNTAENARETERISQEAATHAATGGKAVEETHTAMQTIA